MNTSYWFNGIYSEPMIYQRDAHSFYVTFAGSRLEGRIRDGREVMKGRLRRFRTLPGARRFCAKLMEEGSK